VSDPKKTEEETWAPVDVEVVENTPTAVADTQSVKIEVEIGPVEPKPSSRRKENHDELKQEIEALLFASDEPLALPRIKQILGTEVQSKTIHHLIDQINRDMQAQGHPFELVQIADGFCFRTIQKVSPVLKSLYKDRAMRRLSQPALECLAIIAYRQPITKKEMEAIRGVNTDQALTTLLDKRLIDIVGRAEKPGRPLVYGTTKDFLRYFGINNINELPSLEEIIENASPGSNLIADFKKTEAMDGAAIEETVQAAPEASASPVEPTVEPKATIQ
jgi:segregation and condensation protein B